MKLSPDNSESSKVSVNEKPPTGSVRSLTMMSIDAVPPVPMVCVAGLMLTVMASAGAVDSNVPKATAVMANRRSVRLKRFIL